MKYCFASLPVRSLTKMSHWSSGIGAEVCICKHRLILRLHGSQLDMVVTPQSQAPEYSLPQSVI